MKIVPPKISYLEETEFCKCDEYNNGFINKNDDNIIIESDEEEENG